MATATALALRVAARVHDVNQVELSAAGYLGFVNDAIDDIVAGDWLLPQADDESLTLADSDYDYAVPAGFAYIRRLIVADSVGEFPLENTVPQHHWRVSYDADSAPEIYFFPDAFDLLISGRALKIIGQKRPAQAVAGGATIEPGMEAFIRERATAYAAEYLAGGTSQFAQWRQRISETSWAKSERMLGNHPMEFRCKPSSIHVPSR